MEIQHEKERNKDSSGLVVGKLYKITWLGEDESFIAEYVKKERGFLIFIKGNEKLVCRITSVKIEEK